jgi:hypothetical protein
MPRSRRSTWGRLWRCHLCNPGQAGVREDARCSSEAGAAADRLGRVHRPDCESGAPRRAPSHGRMSRLSPTPCRLPQTPRRCWPGSRAAHSRRTRTAGAHRRRYGQLECGRWKAPGMTANEILHLVARMPGAVAVTASEADRAPEPAWGDTFLFYAPEGDAPGNRRFPFATIVIKVSAGFDTASNLNRPGVFPLNIAVGRDKFRELIGYSPAAHTDIEQASTTRRGPAAPAPGLRIAILGLHPELGCGEQRARARPVVPRSDPSQRTPPAAAVAHFMRRSAAAWGPLRPDEPGAMRSHLALERVLQPQTPDAPR